MYENSIRLAIGGGASLWVGSGLGKKVGGGQNPVTQFAEAGGTHGGKPVTLDILIIDLGDQTYTLGRVTGWSGNHTKMAELASDYVQAYRQWGPVPLSRATKDPNLLPPLMLGVPGLLFANGSYGMTVLDNRGKEVRYEVMSIGKPEKPKKETSVPPTVVPADSAIRAGSDDARGNESVCSASPNAVALLGLEVKPW